MIKKLLSIALLVTLIFSQPATAGEGMWLLSKLKELNEGDMQKAGFKLTADDVYNINKSSMKDGIVHFGGFCTGEIVSPEGLILTNHHCGLDAVQGLSSVGNDLITNGYWATSKDKELPVPGLWVKFLVKVEDVTAKVKGELPDSLTEAQLQAKLLSVYAKITKDATEKTSYMADVRAMFGGNEYFLFVYEKFEDVRLVGAPPFAIGNFGGDTDNWMWPRHTGDFSMFRVYMSPDGKASAYAKDNVPYKSKYFFPISIKPLNEGDYSMTMGYPGRTDRYATSYSVDMALDITSPAIVKVRDKRLALYNAAMAESNEVRIKYQAKKNNVSNYWKYFIGQQKQLKRMKVSDQKRELEYRFTQWVNTDVNRKNEYGNVLPNLKKSFDDNRKYALSRTYLNEAVFAAEILKYANTFTSLEKLLNDKTAKPEDVKAKADELKGEVAENFKEYDRNLDQSVFAALLKIYYTDIPKDLHAPVFAELEKKYKSDFTKYAEDVFKQSMFTNADAVNKFLDNPSAKKINKDMAFAAVKSIVDFYNGSVRPVVKPLELIQSTNNRLFIKGLREMMPDKKFSPDANGTMRLSYGNVKTFKAADAVTYNWFTTLDGVIEKMDKSNPEFVVPAKLVDLYNKKDFGRYGKEGVLRTCFLTDNDITGGNSGSPVINGNGEIIGLAFDGNWEAMSGDIKFDENYKRTICATSNYVLFCIEKLGGAKNIVDEMKVVE